MPQYICLGISIFSIVIMINNIIKYFVFIKNAKTKCSYDLPNRILYISSIMMSLFAAGYIIDAIDTYLREMEPYFIFVAIFFFIGAIFIALLINSQIVMTNNSLVQKNEILKAFVNATEMKDEYTKGHSQHVYSIVEQFYEQLPNRYRNVICKNKLLDAAILHDVGKISISDDILNKNGQLNKEEWAVMKTHPQASKKMLDASFLREISDWVLYHHERIDGNGYFGLKSADIPIASKIIAIADTYSAICTERSYRKKCNHKEAIQIMQDAAGTQLDAELMMYFCQISESTMNKCMD